MLPVAAEEGWTWSTLRAGLAASGEDPGLAESHFPDGPAGAVAAWTDLADREMEAAAAAIDTEGLRTPERIRRVVELRLAGAAPHKRALRRALSVLALPWNAGVALRTAARTASAIWYAAGDHSADFSWYTRRASLGAIYAATLAYWLRDDDPDTAEAMAFFDRRLADLARLQRRRGGGRAAA
jgi:ubiquinone biosynthesis protein COQ9